MPRTLSSCIRMAEHIISEFFAGLPGDVVLATPFPGHASAYRAGIYGLGLGHGDYCTCLPAGGLE